MNQLSFSDVLTKAGINPKDVKLIRHAYSDKCFRTFAEANLIKEYTSHQKNGFSKGYKYWAIFISSQSTLAKFYAIYEVGNSVPDSRDKAPKGIPDIYAEGYAGKYAIFDLNQLDCLKDYENKLIIEWGNATRSWHQKATNEKPIISILPDSKKVFSGFEGLILDYDTLKEIVEDGVTYESFQTALKSIYAIYLIVDKETGKQYVGSAYNKDGLFGRWRVYVETGHGNNKLMKEVICNYPERYHAFQFSILQILPKTVTDDEIVHIETRWKDKLLSKQFGMNDN